MASGRSPVLFRDIRVLFAEGTVAGLTDGQLLERFVRGRGEIAEVAFCALVARHGPMVMGVCTRLLSDPYDAEDAFQATFLVLVRRAGSVRVRDSLASWLYGVSYRIAIRARTYSARRRARETSSVEDMPTPSTGDPDGRDLRSVIDEELARLPDRYRLPVVLCYLGGLSHEEASRQLQCPVGTVKSRLVRGRERLRERLTRRGLRPECGLSNALLTLGSASRAVPTTLRDSTARAASCFKATEVLTGGVASTRVMTLIRVEQVTMVLSKLGAYAAVLLAICGIAAGVGVVAQQVPVAEQRPEQAGGSPASEPHPKSAAASQWVGIEALPDGRIGVSIRAPGSPPRLTVLEPLPGDKFRLISKNEDGTGTEIECSSIRLHLDDPQISVMSPGSIHQIVLPKDATTPPRESLDQETRLRGVERKLDRILQKLDDPKFDSRSRPHQ